MAHPSPGSSQSREVQLLERELAACRAEIAALHDLLEDLPGIFEAKFRQRLQPLLEQRDQLITDNRSLRQQLLAAEAAPGGVLAPARPTPAMASTSVTGLRQRLRQLLQPR